MLYWVQAKRWGDDPPKDLLLQGKRGEGLTRELKILRKDCGSSKHHKVDPWKEYGTKKKRGVHHIGHPKNKKGFRLLGAHVQN